MQSTPINTKYLLGESYPVSFTEKQWEILSPYERDDWAINWLKEQGIKVLYTSHLIRKVTSSGQLVGFEVWNYDYKSLI